MNIKAMNKSEQDVGFLKGRCLFEHLYREKSKNKTTYSKVIYANLREEIV